MNLKSDGSRSTPRFPPNSRTFVAITSTSPHHSSPTAVTRSTMVQPNCGGIVSRIWKPHLRLKLVFLPDKMGTHSQCFALTCTLLNTPLCRLQDTNNKQSIFL